MSGDRCRRVLSVLFGLFACLSFPRSSAAASLDPKLNWHTAKTAHFIVYWYDGEEVIAKRILDICEPIRDRVTKAVDYVPAGRTHLVLTDVQDSANGYAMTIPYNSIRLFITGPTEGSSLENYDDWLTTLLTHEFTHICHMGKVGGMPWVMRGVFGSIISPDEIEPRWIIEGFATYQETALTTGGRGRSSFSDMLVRTAILEHRFPKIGVAGGETEEWPGGFLPYIFGVEFLQYLKSTYGDDRVIEFTRRTAREPFPFYPFWPRFNHNAKKAFGKTLFSLWRDWQKQLETQYAATKAALEAQKLTPVEQLTHSGGSTLAPRVSPDGKTIVYSSSNGKKLAAIRTMDLDGKHDKAVLPKYFSDGFSWSPDGKRIAFGSEKLWSEYYFWDDIYTWSLEEKVLTRMTRGARARTPDYKPDGTEIMFVVNDVSNNDLATLKVDQTVNWLSDNRNWTQYSTPRWRPDGGAVAFSAWLPGGYRDIVIADPKGKTLTRVTADRSIDRDPTWTADGKYLIFSSDRSGISNLYAFEPATLRYLQVTNLLGGAFSPSVTPDNGWIVFQGYNASGYDIYRTKFDVSSWKEIGWTFDPEVYDATCMPGTPKSGKDHSGLGLPAGAAHEASLGGNGRDGESAFPRPAQSAGFASAPALPFAITGPGRFAPPIATDPYGVSDVPVVDRSVALTPDEPAPPGSSLSAEKVTGGGIRPSNSPNKNKGVDLAPYHPGGLHSWNTLLPRYWLPAQLYISESGSYFGAFTGGNDPLFRHSWSAYVNYNTAAAYVGGGGRYFYDRFKPTFYVGGDAYVLDYGQNLYDYPSLSAPGSHVMNIHSTGQHYFEEHRAGTAGAFWFWRQRYFFSLFYLFERRSAHTPLSALTYQPFLPVRGDFAGPTLAVALDRTEAYRYSISPEKGYRITATGQTLEKPFGSQFRKEIATVDGRYYLPVPVIPYSVIGLRGVAGYAQGDDIRPSTFRLGGALGESAFTMATPNYYSLRGFPFNAFGGERMVLGSAEYRFPIWRANRGLGTGPIFLHMLHGGLFVDSGEAWGATGKFDASGLHTGVGAELRLDTVWYYFFPLTIRLGYSFALNNDPAGYKPGDPFGTILTLGTSF